MIPSESLIDIPLFLPDDQYGLPPDSRKGSRIAHQSAPHLSCPTKNRRLKLTQPGQLPRLTLLTYSRETPFEPSRQEQPEPHAFRLLLLLATGAAASERRLQFQH
jgi:hypothetical protein